MQANVRNLKTTFMGLVNGTVPKIHFIDILVYNIELLSIP